MFINDLALQKHFETTLLLSCGQLAKKDKRTRRYLKRLADNAVKAYHFGQSDAQAGKPAAKESEIKELEGASELAQAAIRFAHMAYTAGYESGVN